MNGYRLSAIFDGWHVLCGVAIGMLITPVLNLQFVDIVNVSVSIPIIFIIFIILFLKKIKIFNKKLKEFEL